MSNNIIQLNQELIHNELKDLVKNSVEETLNALLDHEAENLRKTIDTIQYPVVFLCLLLQTGDYFTLTLHCMCQQLSEGG